MELTLADIDPVVAEGVRRTTRFQNTAGVTVAAEGRRQRETAAPKSGFPVPGGRLRPEEKAFRRSMWLALTFCFVSQIAAHIVGRSSLVAELALIGVGYMAPAWGLYRWYGRGLRTWLRSWEAWRDATFGGWDVIPFALHEWEWFLLNLTIPPGQRAYTEAVTALWQAAESGALPEDEARAILGDLNALAAAGRSLKVREKKLAEEQQAHDSGALTAERERLAVRRDAAADEQAREAFSQGVELLDGRLTRAAELDRLRERVEAERAVCAQAFASLQASLLSLGGCGGAAGDTHALQVAAEARTTAARLAGRVRAAEEAVQEVAALRTGLR